MNRRYKGLESKLYLFTKLKYTERTKTQHAAIIRVDINTLKSVLAGMFIFLTVLYKRDSFFFIIPANGIFAICLAVARILRQHYHAGGFIKICEHYSSHFFQ